jgi:predicted NACHT family NTPase
VDVTTARRERQEFARNDFPHADRFIAQSLKRGTLILLFDGLDEVASQDRQRVVRKIKDLMDMHEKCRVIVTCRVAVYDDEFSDLVDKTLEIVEFNDQQVQQFLAAWQEEMPLEKSVEQLLGALRDRPRIMMLARNPLLLTIVAFLCSDPNFILPRSRAEFYQKATALLLEVWHKEHNRYREREKRSVLRHLALQFYDLAERHEKDRRSVNFATVLQDVKAVLLAGPKLVAQEGTFAQNAATSPYPDCFSRPAR